MKALITITAFILGGIFGVLVMAILAIVRGDD